MELTKKEKEIVEKKAKKQAGFMCLGMNDSIKARACYEDGYSYQLKEFTKKALEMKEKVKK
jgi:hypothetical protein